MHLTISVNGDRTGFLKTGFPFLLYQMTSRHCHAGILVSYVHHYQVKNIGLAGCAGFTQRILLRVATKSCIHGSITSMHEILIILLCIKTGIIHKLLIILNILFVLSN